MNTGFQDVRVVYLDAYLREHAGWGDTNRRAESIRVTNHSSHFLFGHPLGDPTEKRCGISGK